jgi:hypothetical protein
MGIVTLAQSFITNQDINACIDEFRDLKKNKAGTLQVKATLQMQDIDILLIGYFILFKQECSTIQIELHLPHNHPDSPVGSLDFKLPQFATYAYLMTGETVFSVHFTNDIKTWDPRTNDIFNDKYFAISRYFMLVCLISGKDKRMFDILFETGLSSVKYRQGDNQLVTGVKGVMFIEDNDDLLSAYRRQIVRSVSTGRRHEAIVQLGRVAFFRSLHEAKILHFYTDSRYQSNPSFRSVNMRAGSLEATRKQDDTSWRSYAYFESVKSLFDSLGQQPLIFQFFFCTLVSSDLLPNTLDIHNKDIFVQRLFGLYNFTRDLVHGLTELARNICEHTNQELGFISARLFLKDDFHKLAAQAANKNSIYQDHLNHLAKTNPDNPPDALLDIHVADLGDEGILPRLLKECKIEVEKEELDEDVKRLLNKDIKKLNNKTAVPTLQELMGNDGDFQLSHQLKPSIAHFGLLCFSGLIQNNKGLFNTSSLGLSGKMEHAVLDPIALTDYMPVQRGTHFTITVPVVAKTGLKAHLPSVDLIMPSQSSEQQIEGMEKLLNYHLVTIEEYPLTTPIVIPENGPVLIDYRVPFQEEDGVDKESAIWKNIKPFIRELLNTHNLKNRCVVNLNVELLNLTESQLFRLISQWGGDFAMVNLLITNLNSEVYIKLIEINKLYQKRYTKMPLWNEQMAVILYHYILRKESTERFYFTDALWGKTESEFERINELLNKHHFNALTILQPEISYTHRSWDLPLPEANQLVIYRNKILLPFDLLLNAGNGLSVFENNALATLQNDMRRKFLIHD